ncbi:MAG: PaaI family thioesterase [Pacificimonas sp.]
MSDDTKPYERGPGPLPAIILTEGPMAGWSTWREMGQGRFSDMIGAVYFRERDDGGIECRSLTDKSHSNMQGALHGGYLMAFIDQVMFAVGRPAFTGGKAVTLSCHTDFVGAGQYGEPVDGTGEIVKATGKTVFLRGLVTQNSELLCSWSGVLRKFPPRTTK